MTRLLFWIALVVLVVMAVRSKLRSALGRGAMPSGAVAPDAAARAQTHTQVADAAERMACCAACGTHFPSSEAVVAAGREYCCAAHAPAA